MAADPRGWPDIPGYQFERLLGSGGNGAVYLARESAGERRRVAVKVLHDGRALRAKDLRRFVREGRLGGELRHAHIAPVLGWGEWEGRPYLVLEHIPGVPLSEVLARRPQSGESLAFVLRVLAQAARALEHAHAHGVVHRDVKPANILVREDGHAFLIDFGIARHLDAASQLTSSGVVMGTPWYMSPEQIVGDAAQVGPATDVYALGVCAYEAATGLWPFYGDNLEELRERVLHQEAPSLAQVAPEVPRALDPVCQRALEKRPEHRYRSAGELAEDLERIANGLAPRAGRLAPRWHRLQRAFTRRRVGLLAAGLLGAVLLAVWAGRSALESRLRELDAEVGLSCHRAQSAFEVEDPEEALARADEAVQRDPDSLRARLTRASLHAQLEQVGRAEEDLLVAGRLLDERGAGPGDPRRRYARALHLAGLRRIAAALDILRPLTEQDLDRDVDLRLELNAAYFTRFQLEREEGHLGSARWSLERYLGTLRSGGLLRAILEAQLRALDGDHAHALAALRPLRDLPDVAESPRMRARIERRMAILHQALGDRRSARECLEGALRALPEDAASLLDLAALVLDGGDLERAETLARRGLELDPHRAVGHVVLGVLAWNRIDERAAIDHLQMALRLEPAQPRARAVMGWMLYFVGCEAALHGREDEAEACYREACRVDPHEFASRVSLALVEDREGRPERAREHLRHSLDALSLRLLGRPRPGKPGAWGDRDLSVRLVVTPEVAALILGARILALHYASQDGDEPLACLALELPGSRADAALEPRLLLLLARTLAASPLDVVRDCIEARRTLRGCPAGLDGIGDVEELIAANCGG